MTATVDLSALRDVLLLETHVAGVLAAPIEAVAVLQRGQSLRCVRAATRRNPFTIGLHDGQGRLLGFVPSCDDVMPARLMDAGQTLEARVSDIEATGERLVVHIHLLLLRDRRSRTRRPPDSICSPAV